MIQLATIMIFTNVWYSDQLIYFRQQQQYIEKLY